MLVSLLLFSAPTEHLPKGAGCITLLSSAPLLWTELPCAEQCSESAGLSAALLSLSSVHVLALSRLLSSFSQLRGAHAMPVCLCSTQPDSTSTCTNRLLSSASLHSLPYAWDKAALTGSWSEKGIFSVEAACSSVNVIKGGLFWGEAGCSLSFALKFPSCIQRTTLHEGRLEGTAHYLSLGRPKPVFEDEFFTSWIVPSFITTGHPSRLTQTSFFPSGGKRHLFV